MVSTLADDTSQPSCTAWICRHCARSLAPANPRQVTRFTPTCCASRRVLAHKVATTLEACHAKEVLQQALANFGSPQIVNTDQGSQFTVTAFTEVVLSSGAKLSMDGRCAWRDNVFIERVWRSIKYERVYLKAYGSVSTARADIAQYFEWYNTQRSHGSVGDVTPCEAYVMHLHKQLKVA